MRNTSRTGGYWAEFPVTYRAEQIATIMSWVTAGESGVVIGGSGSGKSNLAGFLSSRPEAITPYINDDPGQYCFLRLDINSLPALTVPFFYRGLVQGLYDAAETLDPDLRQAMQQLSQGQIDWDDTFAVLILLQKAHHLMIRQAGQKVIWLLDRFDEACRHVDAQTLSSLRSLRDQFKGQLCYAVFTRHPLARLRDPGEIDEFHEIIAANTCWVGPMVERDARWIARQMADRLDVTFAEAAVAQLIQVTGGLPAFMKLGCLALAEGGLDSGQTGPMWVEYLLARPEFQRNCEEIWQDLTAEEQAALLALSGGADESRLERDTLVYLEQTGLLTRRRPDAGVIIFSPLLAMFINRQRTIPAGLIDLDGKTGEVRRGSIPVNVQLSPSEFDLLAYFLDHAAEICEKDDLIEAVWPDELHRGGVSDERLAQLVKRLREKIELDPRRPTYIQVVRGRGYRFVQPEG